MQQERLKKEENIQTAIKGLPDMAGLQSMQVSPKAPSPQAPPPLTFPSSLPTSGGRRTHRNTVRNRHSRRIRASTRALRQRARE